MLSLHRICALVVVFIASFEVVGAHSSPARPLKRLTHPSTLALEILPRRPSSQSHRSRSLPPHDPILRHSDSFRLTVTAFDETYHLHLRPNDHLVHPAARIHYFDTDSNGEVYLDRTEPLLRESVKAYWGEVVAADDSPWRLREDAAGVISRPSRSKELGWARIMVHHQGYVAENIAPVFEGAFSVHGVVHHIMTKDNYFRNKHELDPELAFVADDPDSPLVVWRDSDVMSSLEEQALRNGVPLTLESSSSSEQPRTCGHESLPFNRDPGLNPSLRKQQPTSWYDPFGFMDPSFALGKRDDVVGNNMSTNFEDKIGQTAGCPTSQKIVYMGVAADCAYTKNYGSQGNATQQILNDWNMASALYKSTFNISLGIIELQVQSENCPSTVNASMQWNVDCSYTTVDLNERLSLFSEWRGEKGNDGTGLWHLMSGCPTGTEVGIAWLGTLCQQTASGKDPSVVSGTAVSTAGRTEWQVVAHEIGHNFGAIHDCASGCNGTDTSQCCPASTSSCSGDTLHIMNPTADTKEMAFSDCSIGNICSLMQGNSGWQTNLTCVLDPGNDTKTILSLQMCGNGIVENGEDCDPGMGVNSTCCDQKTCKFTSGSVCDPSDSACCTDSCQFAPSTQVCRPAQDATCDTAEMCTGSSADCPEDKFATNGKSCGSNGLSCANGQCTSLDKQCSTVGASMNLTTGCPSQNDKSCKVSCQDPNEADKCVVLGSSLVDGSACGFGGTCVNGDCQPGSLLDTAVAWYKQNLQISVPVTVVVGIVLIMMLWGLFACIRYCCRRNNDLEPPLASKKSRRISSWESPIIPSGVADEVPAFLQPGTNASFHRAPSPYQGQNQSTASRSQPGAYGRQGPPNPRGNWVDEKLYNGPTR